jgi:flagellar biosynthetic protein FliP
MNVNALRGFLRLTVMGLLMMAPLFAGAQIHLPHQSLSIGKVSSTLPVSGTAERSIVTDLTAKSTPAPTPTTSSSSVSTATSGSAKQAAVPAGSIPLPGVNGGSVPWTIVVLLTFLTIIPSLLLCMTPFARLLIVFHFLRQALGLQTTPSNQTLIGLASILTFFLMQPVGVEIYHQAIVPVQAGQITAIEAVDRASGPVRHFMAHYVRDKDVALFVELAKEPRPASVDDLSMRVMLPAYILSELKAGFQIGTVLFLPFLVVDMVVASITTSVGMLQLPPVVISTPLKLLLFLVVDGWHLLIGSLMRSFN